MKKISLAKKLLTAALGVVIGGINGFFGAGGGMLCVPVLQKLLGKPPKTAHATAILVILPITISSAVSYILNGYFEVRSGLIVAAAVAGGGLVGALLLTKLKNSVITILFALIMIAAGIRMLIG